MILWIFYFQRSIVTVDRERFSLSLSLLFEERESSLEGEKVRSMEESKTAISHTECPESSTFQLSNIPETLFGGRGREANFYRERARVSGEDLVFTREHESKPPWSKFRDVPPRIQEPSPSGFLPGGSIFRSFLLYSRRFYEGYKKREKKERKKRHDSRLETRFRSSIENEKRWIDVTRHLEIDLEIELLSRTLLKNLNSLPLPRLAVIFPLRGWNSRLI